MIRNKEKQTIFFHIYLFTQKYENEKIYWHNDFLESIRSKITMMNRIMDVIVSMMEHAGSNSGFLYFFFFGSSIFFSSSIIITCCIFLFSKMNSLISFFRCYLLKPFFLEVPIKIILAIVPSSAITASSQKIGPNTWWCTTEPIIHRQSFANPRLILKWRGLSLITASIILLSILLTCL